jgi:hypothetical protein
MFRHWHAGQVDSESDVSTHGVSRIVPGKRTPRRAHGQRGYGVPYVGARRMRGSAGLLAIAAASSSRMTAEGVTVPE